MPDYFSAYDRNKCVTGELWPVAPTPLDFRKPHPLSDHINDDYGQLHVVNGYDHAWALNHPGDDSRPAAWIYDKASGRKMEIYTTEPAIHIYTGNGLKGKVKCGGMFRDLPFPRQPQQSAIPLHRLAPRRHLPKPYGL